MRCACWEPYKDASAHPETFPQNKSEKRRTKRGEKRSERKKKKHSRTGLALTDEHWDSYENGQDRYWKKMNVDLRYKPLQSDVNSPSPDLLLQTVFKLSK